MNDLNTSERNYTLILSVISHKLIIPDKKKFDKKSKKKPGAKDKDFHDFLADINFPADQKNYLLLDNAKIHHAVRLVKSQIDFRLRS